jgi:hypothetical protein
MNCRTNTTVSNYKYTINCPTNTLLVVSRAKVGGTNTKEALQQPDPDKTAGSRQNGREQTDANFTSSVDTRVTSQTVIKQTADSREQTVDGRQAAGRGKQTADMAQREQINYRVRLCEGPKCKAPRPLRLLCLHGYTRAHS